MLCMKRANRSGRNSNGAAAFELAAGSLIMIGVLALALNVSFLVSSFAVNDRVCRDATRVAAQGSSQQEAQSMAQSLVIAHNNQGGGFAAPIALLSVVYNDFDGNPPADTSPSVAVTTVTMVKMPAPIQIFGKDIFNAVPVRKTYTFPIVRLKAQTA